MKEFKDRLIITLRFIYDINFIYLFLLLVIFFVFLALLLGHDGEYKSLIIWLEMIGFFRDNESSYFIQVFIIPVYNFLDWLITGKYQVLPKLITKLIKGRISLVLKTSITFLVLLYITSLSVGVYLTNQEEKAAEAARVEKEIQQKKNEKIAMQIAEEQRLKKELLEREKQERLEKIRLAKITYPYQGLKCQYSGKYIEDIVIILKRNSDKSIFNIDLRTRDKVIDGVIYNFETILNSSIKVTEAEIEINLREPAYNQSYNLGDDLSPYTTLTLSRSSLKLSRYYSGSSYSYQCTQEDYEDLYDFVKNHNATITDKNKF